ncbi:MAG: type 1 glutamine amidotransferase [Planctomycetes bacterium]|nr:type 1 glutamine amidotransferase [Planctomycetota bacterium]
MRFLLLQARNPGDDAGPHEHEAFAEILECDLATIEPWSLLQGAPPQDRVDAVDCVLVGGSGEYGVGDVASHPWLSEFIDAMGDLAARGVPTFASCFGFQAICVAAGGEVVVDKERAEVGTFELYVTKEGESDPLFGPLKPRFFAQLGHKDHVTRLPSGVVHLAGSERSPHQALRVEGKPIYATQFHPELSMVRNRERFMRYLEDYSDPTMPDTPEQVLAAYRETTSASNVLKRYVDEILPAYL